MNFRDLSTSEIADLLALSYTMDRHERSLIVDADVKFINASQHGYKYAVVMADEEEGDEAYLLTTLFIKYNYTNDRFEADWSGVPIEEGTYEACMAKMTSIAPS